MTMLFSLIIVYLLQKYLKNYVFFKNLKHGCSAVWVEDLLFKFQILVNNFPKIPTMGATLLLVIAIGILTLLLKTFFYYSSFHLGLLIFNVLLLLYCLSSAERKTYTSMFVASFEQNFAMLFWFTILGQVGLILFWLFSLHGSKPADKSIANNHSTKVVQVTDDDIGSANDVEIAAMEQGYSALTVNNCLYTLHTILAWLPARMIGLVFCLIGDFKKGFSCWKGLIRDHSMMHSEFIDLCGEASLGDSEDDTSELLIERAFVTWLIICIMIGLMI